MDQNANLRKTSSNCARGTCVDNIVYQVLPVYLGEVRAGPADRWRVDDWGHLIEVVLEDPVEEYLVAVMDGLQHLDKKIWQ